MPITNENQPPAIGYSLDTFIGAPLKAAIDSQVLLANSTASFIQDLGYIHDSKGHPTKPRTVPFAYQRTSIDSETNELKTEDIRIDVPLLALVNVPTLEINSLHYTFSMEMKTVNSASTRLYGVISTPREATSKQDRTIKMHLDIQAKQGSAPEGLARVLDLMNQAITPKIIGVKPFVGHETNEEKIVREYLNNLSKEEAIELVELLKELGYV